MTTTHEVINGLPLKVEGKNYVVKLEKKLLEVHDCAGYANLFGNEIHIDAEVTPQDLFIVMIHEVTELIGRMNELGMKHEQVTILGRGIARFLMDNKSQINDALESLESEDRDVLNEILGKDNHST